MEEGHLLSSTGCVLQVCLGCTLVRLPITSYSCASPRVKWGRFGRAPWESTEIGFLGCTMRSAIRLYSSSLVTGLFPLSFVWFLELSPLLSVTQSVFGK